MNLDDNDTSPEYVNGRKQKTYPPPADVGEPPDVVREWAEKVIGSWNLTPKESEICHYMLQGFPTKEIATFTGNTEKTIKHHIAEIFHKAHVGSRAEMFSEILRI